jgi:hypothetical protein
VRAHPECGATNRGGAGPEAVAAQQMRALARAGPGSCSLACCAGMRGSSRDCGACVEAGPPAAAMRWLPLSELHSHICRFRLTPAVPLRCRLPPLAPMTRRRPLSLWCVPWT